MAVIEERIAGIAVRGFKSIADEQRLDIKPLTILAGANSSGKSSFMQPLLLLKQTLEAPADPGALLLDGPNVRFTMADQLLSHPLGKGQTSKFSIRTELLDGRRLESTFRRSEGKGFGLSKMVYSKDNEETVVEPGLTHEQIVKILPPPWNSFDKDVQQDPNLRFEWSVQRERCFFVFDATVQEKPKRRVSFGPYGVSPKQAFVPFIQGVIHLPGLRGNPRRTYGITAGGPDFPGTFERYAASVIAQWQSDGGAKLALLGSTLQTMGLTWKVKAERIDDTQVELKVGRLPQGKRGGAHDLVSIADVGFGVSQSLPVVVALIEARPGQLVYLEQPEIHLHPFAQRRLASVLRDAVERGVVAVIETHSILLLREIQTLIAKGELRKGDVALHWFKRDEDGATTVKTADLDDNGAYGDWPEDFDQTELEAEQEYLDAVEERGSRK